MKNLRLSEVSGLGGSARADYKSCDTCLMDTWTPFLLHIYPFPLWFRLNSNQPWVFFFFFSIFEIFQESLFSLSSTSHLLLLGLVWDPDLCSIQRREFVDVIFAEFHKFLGGASTAKVLQTASSF